MLQNLRKPTLTDEEVKKGTPVRAAFRSQVLTDLESFNDASMALYSKMGSSSAANSFKKFIQEELAWLNANPELSVRQVDTRKKLYVETSELKTVDLLKQTQNGLSKLPIQQQKSLAQQFPIVRFRKQLEQQVNSRSLKVQSNESLLKEQKRKEIENKTTWDIAKEALYYALLVGLVVLFIGIALRIASFCANDSIYKPVPYRILNFVYGFLFAPLIFPYYFYREIWGWWKQDDNLIPHFESLIPLVPYEPKAELTLAERIYGFAKTDKLSQWIQCKQSVEECKKKKILDSDILQQLQKEFAIS